MVKASFEEKILLLDELLTGFRRHVRRHSKHAIADDLDLRISHFVLLRHLNWKGPRRASELADWMAVTRGAISNLMDHLERLGFIHRRRSKTDRRVVEVSITPEGRRTLQEIEVRRVRFLRHIFKDLPADDLDHLLNTLRRLHRQIDELGDPPALEELPSLLSSDTADTSSGA